MTTLISAVAAFALAPAKPLVVVTTTPDLAAIAAAVGGKNANVSSLITGARDPHRLEAKPSFMSRVSKADLFVAVGLDMEIGYESGILAGSRNPRVQRGSIGHLYASEGVPVLEQSANASRAMGDIHPAGNPHYWHDPFNARIIAKKMAERMSTLQPSISAEFRENASAFSRAVDERMFGAQALAKFGADKLWEWDSRGVLLERTGGQLGGWASKMAPHRGKAVLAYHRSWVYLAHRFGLRIVGELEPKPGLDPTPGHIGKVIQIGKQEGVRAILQEPYYSDRASKFVAQRLGARVVRLAASVGQDPSAKDYLTLIDSNLAKVASALGG